MSKELWIFCHVHCLQKSELLMVVKNTYLNSTESLQIFMCDLRLKFHGRLVIVPWALIQEHNWKCWDTNQSPCNSCFQAADDTMEHQTAYLDSRSVSMQKSFSFPEDIWQIKDNTRQKTVIQGSSSGLVHSIENTTALAARAAAQAEGTVGLPHSKAAQISAGSERCIMTACNHPGSSGHITAALSTCILFWYSGKPTVCRKLFLLLFCVINTDG